MELDARLNHLLARWRASRERGEFAAVDDICRDAPELKAEFSQMVETAEFDEQRPSTAVPSTAVPSADQIALPAKIGRYNLHQAIGAGSFGKVYRAFDEELERWVAVKIPHAGRLQSGQGIADFLREARQAAQLDHPNILTVFDVGRIGDTCFIVYKLIEGEPLNAILKRRFPDPIEVSLLVAQIADALDYAHRCGLYHRDVKLSNVLLDQNGIPFLVDFGLAVREVDLAQERRTRAGTIPYMSPEQVRGEGHRIDGRTDIYSLGVVLYELFTSHRPFEGRSSDELIDEILHRDVIPPRQLRSEIPRELERICLKAMSKRVTDRYTTAKDMAEELRAAVAGFTTPASTVAGESSKTHPLPELPTGSSRGSARETLSGLQVRIVPKGLQSFGPEDSDFFLELLPGPKNREGLPDSVRFWKTRIESRDANESFPVGLMYGPSGCGKSSMVKAGLLPRLADFVKTSYVDATRDDTEGRIKKSLGRLFPQVSSTAPLPEIFATLRRRELLISGQKLLLICDQFEQWLHGHGQEDDNELLSALRQCDGVNIQCIVMVRDDFWLAISRFMHKLEVPLREGRNIALVDRFDSAHARKVLAAFGQAFQRLPDDLTEVTADERRFLEQAIRGLAQDGEIIPVQLSLFAEMLKGKAWLPQTLKSMGGVEGVGLAFLEETFNARTANPEHRVHQVNAKAVLSALLPEPGLDLKGQRRSRRELAAACGLPEVSARFQRLIQMLDSELHVITPTESEADSIDEQDNAVPQYYQLAHDYLVPPLRLWLTQERRRSWRGRAELNLENCTTEWSRRHDSRSLPPLLQYLSIAVGVPWSRMTSEQRLLFSAASSHYGRSAVLGGFVLAVVVGMAWFGQDRYYKAQSRYAESLVVRLIAGDLRQAPTIIAELNSYRRWVNPMLRDLADNPGVGERDQMLVRLAMLPADINQLKPLKRFIANAEPDVVLLLRESFRPYSSQLNEEFWRDALAASTNARTRVRDAAVLAALDTESARWRQVDQNVATALLAEPATDLPKWCRLLQPVAEQLREPLRQIVMRDLPRLNYDEPGNALDKQILAKEMLAEEQAKAAIALFNLGFAADAWPLLSHRPDPSARTRFVFDLAPVVVEPQTLAAKLAEVGVDPAWRRAIILALAQYGNERLSDTLRAEITPKLVQLYRDDPDPGVHSAAAWLLDFWGNGEQRNLLDRELTTHGPVPGRNWFVTPQRFTFAIATIPQTPAESDGESGPADPAPSPRTLAVATTEVTVDQFRRFRPEFGVASTSPNDLRLPVLGVWFTDAMEYCNWLTRIEAVPADQLCYREIAPEHSGVPPGDVLNKTGYRLPTKAELMFFCRAGTETPRFYGESDQLLSLFCWHQQNSEKRPHAVGLLRPNDFGLFDSLGNASEWVHETREVRRNSNGSPILGYHYGGWYNYSANRIRFDFVIGQQLLPNAKKAPSPTMVGLRIVRTVARPPD